MSKIAILGAGRIAEVHARAIREAGAEIASIYDIRDDAATALADRFGTRAARSAEAAITAPDVDGVIVATSTDTHVDFILAAARAGKAVMCEKPVDLSVERAEMCRKGLKGLGAPVQIGFNRRFDPTHAAVAAAVRDGAIGRIENLLIVSRDPGPPPADYIARSGGLFKDMTIHDFDMARFILGEEPTEISASGSVLVDDAIGAAGDIDSASVQMRTASGALCQIVNSRRAVYGYDQRVEAFGSAGMVSSDNPRATAMLRSDADVTEARAPLMTFFLDRYAESYRLEILSFLQIIARGAAPAVTFEDGYRALVIAEAAGQALRDGRTVKIPTT